MATNPMHQFNVYRIGPEVKIAGIDISFTNSSLFMLLSAGAICIFLLLGTREKKLIPGLTYQKFSNNKTLQNVKLESTKIR